MSAYWWGVLTIPVVVGSAFVLFWGWAFASVLLKRRGFFGKVRFLGRERGATDYVIRHNVWWERQFGPIFIGGWYRETTRRLVNRWIGVGHRNGPHVFVGRERDLGPVDPSA